MPLVHRGMFLFRIANRYKIEWYKIVREIKDGFDWSYPFLVGIDACPYSSEPDGMSSEKNVF